MLKILDKNQFPGDEAEIFSLLGMTARDPVSERIRGIARDEIQTARTLIEPKGIWLAGTLQGNDSGTPFTLAGLKLASSDLERHLTGCQKGVILGVTIGNRLETAVDGLFSAKEYTRAAILDAIGSQFAEEAANQLTELFRATYGLSEMTRRFSPGYGDWSIRVQPELLKLLDAEKIGLKSNEACILVPRKSITAVAGYKC